MAILNGTSGSDALVTTSIFADTLYGYAGDDTLDGGLGSDRLIGGQGNDTYILSGPGDVVVELANEGIDTVQAAFSVDLRRAVLANVENVRLTGFASRADGSDVANSLWGNAWGNTLYGYGGNDTLYGEGGNDLLDGGSGDDALFGGTGRDTLRGGAGSDTLLGAVEIDVSGGEADVLIGGAGDDTYLIDNNRVSVVEQAGEGYDTAVVTYGAFTLAANVEALFIIGQASVVGNAQDNLMRGGEAADELDGGAGVDSLYGGFGDDIYTVDSLDDRVFESTDGGKDTVRYAATADVDLAYWRSVENFTLLGDAAVDVLGTQVGNVIQGNRQANVLHGLGGDDVLAGGGVSVSGTSDTLSGGLGNDTYLFTAQDSLVRIEEEGGQADVLAFQAGISLDQLVFSRVDADLRVQVADAVGGGLSRGVLVAGWFTSADRQVETIAAGGASLDHQQVNALVSAMALPGGAASPGGAPQALSQPTAVLVPVA